MHDTAFIFSCRLNCIETLKGAIIYNEINHWIQILKACIDLAEFTYFTAVCEKKKCENFLTCGEKKPKQTLQPKQLSDVTRSGETRERFNTSLVSLA